MLPSFVTPFLDRLVPVSAELDNINNYYTIQHYRFGSRLSLKIDMEGDTNQIPGLYIPKLTLQRHGKRRDCHQQCK